MLGQDQIDRFHRDGFLVAPDAVTPAQLAGLNVRLAGWIDESRAHTKPFGEPCIDGRGRFDMGAEHTPELPALRRVNCPSDISSEYEAVMRDSSMVDMVAALIGGSTTTGSVNADEHAQTSTIGSSSAMVRVWLTRSSRSYG